MGKRWQSYWELSVTPVIPDKLLIILPVIPDILYLQLLTGNYWEILAVFYQEIIGAFFGK